MASESIANRLPSFLLCTVCSDVLTNPAMTLCGHTFCLACITQWLANNHTCPTCKMDVSEGSIVNNLAARNMLLDIPVKCVFSALGCKDSPPFKLLTEHEGQCVFGPATCVNAGCPFHTRDESHQLQRKDLKAHQSTCEWRTVKCPNSCLSKRGRKKKQQQRTLLFKDVENHINTECPLQTVRCPFDCATKLVRNELSSHTEACPNKPVPCGVAGCSFEASKNSPDLWLQHWGLPTSKSPEEPVNWQSLLDGLQHHGKSSGDAFKAISATVGLLQQSQSQMDEVCTNLRKKQAEQLLTSSEHELALHDQKQAIHKHKQTLQNLEPLLNIDWQDVLQALGNLEAEVKMLNTKQQEQQQKLQQHQQHQQQQQQQFQQQEQQIKKQQQLIDTLISKIDQQQQTIRTQEREVASLKVKTSQLPQMENQITTIASLTTAQSHIPTQLQRFTQQFTEQLQQQQRQIQQQQQQIQQQQQQIQQQQQQVQDHNDTVLKFSHEMTHQPVDLYLRNRTTLGIRSALVKSVNDQFLPELSYPSIDRVVLETEPGVNWDFAKLYPLLSQVKPHTLVFRGGLNVSGTAQLFAFIADKSEFLQAIDLKGSNLGPQAIPPLVECLGRLERLQILDLEENALGNRVTALLPALKKLRHLKHISLSNNGIDGTTKIQVRWSLRSVAKVLCED